ncbi:hypothetical protein ACLOJK_033888 [Asimina triloba]
MACANLHRTAGFSVKNILKHFRQERGKIGILMTSTPKRGGENVAKEESIKDEEGEPIVAFNKPPLPPVVGPLVAFSLLQMGSRREGHDD